MRGLALTHTQGYHNNKHYSSKGLGLGTFKNMLQTCVMFHKVSLKMKLLLYSYIND